MQEENQKSQKNPPVLKYVAVIGFFGGLLWSLTGFLFYYLNFMEVSPKFILTSWSDARWIERFYGWIIAVLLYSILSVAVALLYYAVFRKIKSIFGGIGFGILLWLLMFGAAAYVIPDLPSLGELTWDTGITTGCLLVLYGTFVGYSVSYEYEEYQKTIKKQENPA